MQSDYSKLDALTYASDSPDIEALAGVYTDALSDLSSFLTRCQVAYADRRCQWPGKSVSGKKEGADAFPWQGASDLEAPVIEERTLKLVGKCQEALSKSHIKAYPIGVEDAPRAEIVSTYLKWLQTNGIEGFTREAARAGNFWFEKAVMITAVNWERKSITAKHTIDTDYLEEQFPELAEALRDPQTNEEQLEAVVVAQFKMTPVRARRAIKELRDIGETEVQIVDEQSVDRPSVTACAPDVDVFFPSWVQDPQKSPWVAWRALMTPQEILAKVTAGEWDKEWAENVIETQLGQASTKPQSHVNNSLRGLLDDPSGLIEVVYFFQRLVDKDDDSEGIYRTVFCPSAPTRDGQDQYAKRELLSGLTYYPLVVTSLLEDETRLYDSRSLPDLARSAQQAIKAERDARRDANSLRNNPPLMHPAGRPPTGRWGAGGRIGFRNSPQEYTFADTPAPNPQSIKDEQAIELQIDKMLGLAEGDSNGGPVQNYFIRRFLEHQKEVLGMCYDFCQLYGPKEQYFQITGQPGLKTLEKRRGEKLDITITFDSLFSDPDTVQKMLETFSKLFAFDTEGVLGKRQFVEFTAAAVSPTLAAHVVQPPDQARKEIQNQVFDDLTQISAGIERNAQPNGAQVALATIQQWASQPDVAQRLGQDEAFRKRVEKYASQYIFQMQQQENAEIGRIGTEPAGFTQ